MKTDHSIPSVQTRSDLGLSLVLGLGLGLVVFLAIPLMQMVTHQDETTLPQLIEETAPVLPPPPPPPPPPTQVTREDVPSPTPVETSPEIPPLPVPTVAVDWRPGVGHLQADLGTPTFQVSTAALGSMTIFEVRDVDQAPIPLVRVAPEVPLSVQRRLREGRVTVLFYVDESGVVHDPRIESTTDPALNDPVLEAVRRWRFKPGTRDGRNVRVWLRQPFDFQFR